MTQGRKIAVFGMALESVCGMLMIFVIRFTWHILANYKMRHSLRFV